MTALSLLLKVTLILGTAIAVRWIARRSRASVRHLLLAASFAMLLVLPAATLISPTVGVTIPSGVESALLLEPLDLQPIYKPNEPAVPTNIAILPTRQPAWNWPSRGELMLAVWLMGLALFLLPVIVGLRQISAIRRAGIPWLAGQTMAQELVERAKLRRPIDLLLTDAVSGPMTCGVIRPAILLPAEAATWSPADLTRAIVHEFEHVRRLDWLTQCLARVVAASYWFHPLVWVAWRQFALEAERACDDAVLASERASEDTAYADQLVYLAGRLSASSTEIHLAMANRHDLSSRITAVLDQRQRRGRAGHVMVIAATSVAAVALCLISPLQISVSGRTRQVSTGPQPRFEVASIKPCKDEEDLQPSRPRGGAGGTNATASPGRFAVPCVTLEQLIYLSHASYGAHEEDRLENDYMGEASDSTKVRGGPDWVHSHRDKWAIEATAPGVTDRYILMGSMLRALLEDRFKLKIHRDTETVPMYALRLSKGGLKIKPLPDGECDGRRSDEQAAKGVEPCGRMQQSSGTLSRLHFVGFKLSFLARAIAGQTGVHVVDETGVSDQFIIDLKYAAEASPAATELDPSAPSLFTALEQQLGLRLEKIAGKRGFIVVDHADKPAPDTDFGDEAYQTAQATQRFEVVSIKPKGPFKGPAEIGISFLPGGRLLAVNAPIHLLLMDAFNVSGMQLDMRTIERDLMREVFDIEATAGAGALPASASKEARSQQMRLMLQSLLADRFKLRLHKEARDVPMYALVVAPGGSKLKASPSDRLCPSIVRRCGSFEGGPAGGVKGFDVEIPDLVSTLIDFGDRHVLDRTGIKGKFDIELPSWTRPFLNRPPDPDNKERQEDPNDPTISAVLQRVLGLKLDSIRGPLDFIVVDHIERPSPNLAVAASGASTGGGGR